MFAGEQWPGVDFSEVRAYAWPAKYETEAVVLSDMSLDPKVLNPDGAPLSPKQVDSLLSVVRGEHRKYAVASCHVPHNAFVFYDAAKKPVAYIEICFGCLNHRIAPQNTSRFINLPELAVLFSELKLPLGEYPDAATFKKHFRERTYRK